MSRSYLQLVGLPDNGQRSNLRQDKTITQITITYRILTPSDAEWFDQSLT
jgi:hypothetical protein